jgi:hypothetical protein
MHSALFVAHVPKDRTAWENFRNLVLAKLRQQKGIAALSENVWLVNFHQSPSGLAWLVAYAEQQKIAYGLLQFEKPPEWLPVGFDPSSIQE